jgi:hypothetical protein
MMKKLLLVMILLPVLQLTQAQEEIVKWTFPNGQLGDTVQNGTNPLNLTQVISITGAGPITMTNGATNFAATATNWNDGMNTKYWMIKFKTTGYNNVKISSKQRAGGTNGGPRDFKMQYRQTLSGIWADVPGGEVTLGNDWFSGVIANLDLPADCQNQPDEVTIRWVMATNTDVNGGTVAATGISKIDDIIVTGILITGLNDEEQAQILGTYPNPSTSSFTVNLKDETSELEIFNSNGQSVYKIVPECTKVTVEKTFPAGLYFVKATSNGKVSLVKHIIK